MGLGGPHGWSVGQREGETWWCLQDDGEPSVPLWLVDFSRVSVTQSPPCTSTWLPPELNPPLLVISPGPRIIFFPDVQCAEHLRSRKCSARFAEGEHDTFPALPGLRLLGEHGRAHLLGRRTLRCLVSAGAGHAGQLPKAVCPDPHTCPPLPALHVLCLDKYL